MNSPVDGIYSLYFLDVYSTFRRVYETPILKSRAPGCSRKEKEVGEGRQAQVSVSLQEVAAKPELACLSAYGGCEELCTSSRREHFEELPSTQMCGSFFANLPTCTNKQI